MDFNTIKFTDCFEKNCSECENKQLSNFFKINPFVKAIEID